MELAYFDQVYFLIPCRCRNSEQQFCIFISFDCLSHLFKEPDSGEKNERVNEITVKNKGLKKDLIWM